MTTTITPAAKITHDATHGAYKADNCPTCGTAASIPTTDAPTVQDWPTADTLDLKVKIVNVKPSDHSYYGMHDVITVELTDDCGNLPAGLRFTMRRPHDGTADLRSEERKAAKSSKAAPQVVETATVAMSKDQLLSLADARKIDVAPKATKAEIVALLNAAK